MNEKKVAEELVKLARELSSATMPTLDTNTWNDLHNAVLGLRIDDRDPLGKNIMKVNAILQILGDQGFNSRAVNQWGAKLKAFFAAKEALKKAGMAASKALAKEVGL